MSQRRFPATRLDEAALETLTAGLDVEPVLFAYLHGSAAEGRPFRDLDVAVYPAPGAPGLEDPLWFELDMASRLEGHVLLPVDLHLLHQAPIGFCYWASRGRLLAARDPDALASWKERVWSEYFDLEPYFRDQTRILLGLAPRGVRP